jgi:peptide deformylase
VPVQPIRFFGDPVLTTTASLVSTFDKELRNLVSDLLDTMHEAPGAGLAAPQIGVSLQVFVWDIEEGDGHLINPSLELSSDIQEGEEGCLSFPGLTYETVRSLKAIAKGFNMFGEPVIVEGTELLARVLQHETDHLNGIVFIDRLSTSERKIAMADIRNSDWFNEAIDLGSSPTVKFSPHSLKGMAL